MLWQVKIRTRLGSAGVQKGCDYEGLRKAEQRREMGSKRWKQYSKIRIQNKEKFKEGKIRTYLRLARDKKGYDYEGLRKASQGREIWFEKVKIMLLVKYGTKIRKTESVMTKGKINTKVS